MAKRWTAAVAAVAAMTAVAAMASGADKPNGPIVSEDVVFEEVGGVVAVEAEHFFKQTHVDVRAWYLTTPQHTPNVSPDGDGNHAALASGGAYVEILPDTRRSHGDKLIHGQNFSPAPGKMAILYYKVHFNTPGKYYVWGRIFSTNSEDNGLHVGLDGAWPASGQRMQWIAKQKWVWASKQRTEKKHTGEPYKLFLEIDKPGEHVIQFGMREDGTEFDKWLMTRERKDSVPGPGPAPRVKKGTLPKPYPVPEGAAKAEAAEPGPAPLSRGAGVLDAVKFPLAGSGFYGDKGKWLAVNPDRNKSARASMAFPFETGTYHVTLHAVGENDGQSRYDVTVGTEALATFRCPRSAEMFAEGSQYNATWKNVKITKGQPVAVKAAIGSADGKEYSRARWSKLVFVRADGKPASGGTK